MPLQRESIGRLASVLVGLTPRSKLALVLAVDAALICVASYCLFFLLLRQPADGNGALSALVALGPVFVIPALYLAGAYDVMMRFWSSNQLIRILVGTVAGLLTLGAALWALSSYTHYWNLMVIQAMAICFSLAWVRFAASALLRPVTHGVKSERVLIYGAGRAGTQLSAALMASGEYWPIAFVDDRLDKQGRLVSGLRVFAPEQLEKLRQRLKFKRVLLAMPSASPKRRADIVKALEPLAVKVMVLPGVDELACGAKRADELREVQVEDLLGREPVAPDAELMDAFIAGKSVMITGAGGSIGSELCRQVLARGARKLVLFEMSEFALYNIERELSCLVADCGTTEIVPVLGSVLDRAAVERALQRNGVQTIYHAAAYKHVPLVEGNILSGVQNNIMGTRTVAESAVSCGVANFVLVSSDKAVRPTSVMGATKRVQELIVQAMAADCPGMRVSMVRFGNVLASSGSVVPLFREQIRNGGPVTVTHEDVTRYFMTIPEAAQLVIQAGALGGKGDIFVLDMGEPVRIYDLARRMIHLSGLEVRDEENPSGAIEVVVTGLRPGEKLYEELLIDAAAEPTRHKRISRAREAGLSRSVLNQKLAALESAVSADKVSKVLSVLKEMVSGYAPPQRPVVAAVSPSRPDDPPESPFVRTAAAPRKIAASPLAGGMVGNFASNGSAG